MVYKKKIFFFIFFFLSFEAHGSVKESIIAKLNNTSSLSFNFTQKIDGKLNDGSCKILYPKKIFCKYKDKYNKEIISNGKTLVIKNLSIDQIYRYDLQKTPFKVILDKEFLIEQINLAKINIINDNKSSIIIKENNLNFKIFFDLDNHSILGWETIDIYQNTVKFEIFDLVLNISVSDNIFKIN